MPLNKETNQSYNLDMYTVSPPAYIWVIVRCKIGMNISSQAKVVALHCLKLGWYNINNYSVELTSLFLVGGGSIFVQYEFKRLNWI